MSIEELRSQLQAVNLEYEEFKETARILEEQLDLQNSELRKANKALALKLEHIQREMEHQRQKHSQTSLLLEKEVQLLRRERTHLEHSRAELQRGMVELENINQSLQQELRANESLLEDYRQKVELTLEKYALMQTDFEENRNSSQEQIERMRVQLRETEEHLAVVQAKYRKHQDEMGKRSLCSSASMRSKDLSCRSSRRDYNQSYWSSIGMVQDIVSKIENRLFSIRAQLEPAKITSR